MKKALRQERLDVQSMGKLKRKSGVERNDVIFVLEVIIVSRGRN